MNPQTKTVRFSAFGLTAPAKEEAKLSQLRREGWVLRDVQRGTYILTAGTDAKASDFFMPVFSDTGGRYSCRTHGEETRTAADSAIEWLHTQGYAAEKYGEYPAVLVLHDVPEAAVTHLRYYRALCRYRDLHNAIMPAWGLVVPQLMGLAVDLAFGGRPDTVWCVLMALTLPFAMFGTVRLLGAKREYRRFSGAFTPARDGTAASLLQYCRSAELFTPEDGTPLPLLPEPALLDFQHDLRHYLCCTAERGRRPENRGLRRAFRLLMQSKPAACGQMRFLAQKAQRKRGRKNRKLG